VYTQKRFVALTGTDARGDSGADCTQGLIRVIDKYLKHTGEVSTGDGGDTMERWYSLNKDPDWDGPEDDNTLIKLMSKSSSRAAFGDGVSFLDLYEANEEKLAVAYPPIGSGEPYDRSSADMALACRLAFWAGKDPERIERIMLQSKLKRDKWDNRPVNYLRVTILKACDKQTDVLGGKKKQDEASASARLTADGNDQKPDKAMHNVTQLDGSGQSADLGWNIVSIADIHTNPPKPQLFFIDGWLPAHVLTFFAGHGGTGKSMLALQAAVCLAMGLPFMGKATIKCRVLFFSAEDSTETIRRRLIKICIGMKIGSSILDETLEIIDATKNPYLFTEHTNKKGETTNGYAELRTQIKTFNANVIIIDNASDTFDANENNRAQVRAFVRALVQLGEESHTTVLLLAHVDKLTAKGEGSSESYSGVTAWHNSARSRWYLTSDGRLLTLQHKKSNFGPLSPGIKMGWSPEGLLISLLDNDPLVHREDILITVLALIKRHYENGSYISPASNSGTNAYNILKGEAEFPKSITRQMQLTPLLERAIKEGRLCVEEYKKDKNTQKRYKVNESTLI
jgi:archaellum biogenesis ATPase FlaH